MGRQGLEHAPWNSTEDFSSNESLYIRCKEEDEDDARHGSQSTDHGLSVSKPFTDETIDNEADNFAGTGTIRPVGNKCLVLAALLKVEGRTTHSASSLAHCIFQSKGSDGRTCG